MPKTLETTVNPQILLHKFFFHLEKNKKFHSIVKKANTAYHSALPLLARQEQGRENVRRKFFISVT